MCGKTRIGRTHVKLKGIWREFEGVGLGWRAQMLFLLEFFGETTLNCISTWVHSKFDTHKKSFRTLTIEWRL